MQESNTISCLCVVAILVIVMPIGYFVTNVQAQLVPPPTSPSPLPSAPAKTTLAKTTTTPKAAPTALRVDVIMFGVDNKTGNVVTFVTAKNHTEAVAFNATDADIKHENSTGVAEAFFTLHDVKLKVGEKFQACNVLVKDLNLVCTTGFKSPLNRTESVNLAVTGPATLASKTPTG